MHRVLLSLICFCLHGVSIAAPPDFDKQIAPLLAARCLDCHSGPKPKGGLDLSRKANMVAADVGKRVDAGEMPPKKPLPDGERQLLREWIEGGAKWGTDPIDPFRFSSASRAGYDWWALLPIHRSSVPEVKSDERRISNPIDAFIHAKLVGRGLTPSPPAERRILIRRLYADLLGLPPSPEEVEAFVKNPSHDGYEQLVEKLLASPHYGERWARHWLDVVRYGETDGFERNSPRPSSWHYRDWVIRALNADMPYDEFARLQLAGDVIRPQDPDAVKATGYLVAGVHNTVLGNDQMRAVARQDELEDIVGSVAQTFLAMTVNCARCHDHKFDPISQTDYYRLAALLGGVGFGERPIPDAKAALDIERVSKELDVISKTLAGIEEPARRAVIAERGLGNPGAIALPSPLAAWDFRKSLDDLVGKLHARGTGGVKLTAAGATFDGKTGLLRTPPMTFNLSAKTLEAWVRLDSLSQRGGGVISVQTLDGGEFDAIVFGEQEPGRWMAGSDGFRRYKSFGGAVEKEAGIDFVHIAIAFAADGTVTGYRNGKPYGKGYSAKVPKAFENGKAVVVFGCRHEPVGGNKMLAGAVSVARLYDRVLSPEQVLTSFERGRFATDSEIDAKLPPGERIKRAKLLTKRDQLGAELASTQQRSRAQSVFAVVPQAPGLTRFLVRGDVTQPGAVIAPGGLTAIRLANFALKPDASDAERRKKLAEWVTNPENPLFTRTIVNRVWHYHFGAGIVETPSDFGFNGGRPSHPELLDWLAAEFAARKYSLKALHRIIVTSATYRQASAPRKDCLATDADNRLLWRFRPLRLEGEALRDGMLALSGLLNRELGGKGFSDYKGRELNGTAYFDPYDPTGFESQRRSIYRFTPRGANRGLIDAFDCPDPAAAAPRRTVTTTPLQALSLWNSGFALRTADAFADRLSKEAMSTEKRVRRAWLLAYQRDPTTEEAELAEKLVANHGLRALCRALFNSNEFVIVD